MSDINLTLSKDEALILFEFLARFAEKEKLEIEFGAEEQVLWNLHANLEKMLSEPFRKEYSELLEVARRKFTYE